jgi:hypothetical protein
MSDQTATRMLLGVIDEFDQQTEFPGAPKRAVLNFAAENLPVDRDTAAARLVELEAAGRLERYEDTSTLVDAEGEITKIKRTAEVER